MAIVANFMQPEITDEETWWKLDHPRDGITFFPASQFTKAEVREQIGSSHADITKVKGWGARLTAPGYLDCTEWVVCASAEGAWDYLAECYPDIMDDYYGVTKGDVIPDAKEEAAL